MESELNNNIKKVQFLCTYYNIDYTTVSYDINFDNMGIGDG